jgi:hypothetical protein
MESTSRAEEEDTLKPRSRDASQHSTSRKPVAGVEPSGTVYDWVDKDASNPPGIPTSIRCSNYAGIVRIWWLEILGCFLFCGALLALIITVSKYAGQEPFHWRYGISINTLLAIYSIILRGAVFFVMASGLSQLKWSWYRRERRLQDMTRYDNASRGPFGAIVLLFTLRDRQLVASLGALVTVGTLLVEPFVQGLISIQTCDLVSANINASVARINYFEEAAFPGQDETSVNVGLQNAISLGLYTPGSPANFECATGNCSFTKPYSSVGYCGSCVDLTNNLTIQIIPDIQDTYYTVIYNISLPQIASDNGSTWIHVGDDIQSGVFSTTSYGNITDVVVGFDTSSNGICVGNPGNISVVPQKYTWPCDIFETPGSIITAVGAARCTLAPCIKTYTAIVVNSILKEEVTATEMFDDDDGLEGTLPCSGWVYPSQKIDVGCLSSSERDALTQDGANFTGASWITNATQITSYSDDTECWYEFVAHYTNVTISGDCIYGYDLVALQSLEAALNGWLTGSLSYSENGLPDGPAQLQTLYNGGNLTFDRLNETWHNISDSITKYMRELEAPNDAGGSSYRTPAIGEVHFTQSCIQPQWAFITYPIVIVVLSLVFFAAMLLESSFGQPRQDWKSSPLALMFHGLDQRTIEPEDSHVPQSRDMERFAKATAVQMRYTDRGWKLARVNKDFEVKDTD